MDNILKELDATFRLISTIPVSGDAVDAMATARNTLRKVYVAVQRLSEKKEVETDG